MTLLIILLNNAALAQTLTLVYKRYKRKPKCFKSFRCLQLTESETATEAEHMAVKALHIHFVKSFEMDSFVLQQVY